MIFLGLFPIPGSYTHLDVYKRQLPDRHVVLASLLTALAEVLTAFAVDGFFGLKSEWQRHHAWQGLPVQILGDDAEPLLGICLLYTSRSV